MFAKKYVEMAWITSITIEMMEIIIQGMDAVFYAYQRQDIFALEELTQIQILVQKYEETVLTLDGMNEMTEILLMEMDETTSEKLKSTGLVTGEIQPEKITEKRNEETELIS